MRNIKKVTVIKVILIMIVLLILFKIIPVVILKILENNEKVIIIQNQYGESNKSTNVGQYNIIGLIKRLTQETNSNIKSEDYNIILENNLPYTNNKTYSFIVTLGNLEDNSTYVLKVNNQTYNLNEGENDIKYNLNNGKNILDVSLEKNNVNFYSTTLQKAYVDEYESQFFDVNSKNSISTHFDYNLDDERTIELLKYLGIKEVRDDISWKDIEQVKGQYNFEKYDKWITKLYENNIELIAIMNNPGNILGSDEKISNESEMKSFVNFVSSFATRYPMIEKYEILNEENLKYTTKDEMKYYIEAIKILNDNLKQINNDIEIWIGGTAGVVYDEETKLSSTSFIKYILEENPYMNEISIHQYDEFSNVNWVKKCLNEHEEMLNNLGGFNKINISEYGASSYSKGFTEEEQAYKILKQSIIYNQYNVVNKVIYNSRNIGNTVSAIEHNYGIIENDYTPKPAYYALKNYYENTNGSEYIGTINLVDGLETHVYNKDGKPKIVTWSNTKDQTIQIDYANFTAKDIYGNDIENTNGKLDITTSPVYLDNISTKYFYEAISNTALEKYSEFEEKFATEIASVEGLQENINTSKQYLESISNIESETEEIAKQKMQEHFNLGNQILTAYKDKALDVEYVKLSSMLDMLNEIGDSFEDLVTVTVKTRNPDLENTKTLIDNTEQAINNNNDLDIVYPEKILEFSKELYEDSEYINNLEEENDIKTGLIVSYDLHAKYLADWANTFTNLYIDKYIEDNPVTESYSATSLTNQDVTVTLNIPQDVKITNNEGSNTYTFTENGTFTFEYERRGKTDSKLVSVNYIDKTSPEITNVENGEVYTQSITPNASDEHLDKVQLTFRGQVIEDYEVGDELTEEGDYKLTATDTVGNTSTVKFYIMKEDSTYKIKDSNILNIRPETTVKDFKENFTVIEGYTIKREDTELTDEDVISTGDVLEETDGNKFTLIVRGDLNCDGRLSIVDLSIERKYLLEIIDIDENQKLSSDMNTDEETSLMDLSIMRKTILGIIK